MAEALGVAAGAIGVASFALQLGQAVAKLKDFCDRVKDAPAELRDYIEEIELSSKILESISSDGAQHACMDQVLLQESVSMSRKAIENVKAVADELQATISRKRIRTSVKMVLKDDVLQRALAKLARADSALQKAYTIYRLGRLEDKVVSSITTLHDQVCRVQQTQTLLVSVSPEESPSSLLGCETTVREDQSQQPVTHSGRQRPRLYQVRLPSMVGRRALELSVKQAMSGWDFSLRYYRILLAGLEVGSHPAWGYCARGSVAEIQCLLQRGELGLNDQFETGESLVTVAAAHSQRELVRYLFDHGASMSMDASRFTTLIQPERTETVSRFLEWQADAKSIAEQFDLNVRCSYQALMAQPFSHWASWERWAFLHDHCDMATAVLQHLLGGDSFDPSFYTTRSDEGLTLLHLVALQVGQPRNSDKAINSIVEDAISAGAELHVEWQNQWIFKRNDILVSTWRLLTPLGLLLREVFRNFTSPRDAGFHLTRWINALALAGVDLEHYGRMEAERIQCLLRAHERANQWWQCYFACYMSHGPDVKDWKFWERHLGDIYCSVFWDMVEHPEMAVPGAWQEEEADEVKVEDDHFAEKYWQQQRRREDWLERRAQIAEVEGNMQDK